ncbi:MFS transporter [Serinibacter salmoneus]|uniref:Putative MFS family arabinose efflux permease n=1 Tax=Serinibacter salmoneus TaxID=556530 RepID=A0A2A9D3J8_9MICO|nr:MFS transporter [Serinibacter salmoneus]PFG20532.1 putative MFS family arabinose efflux permease [Serinibacter salmoneus]
MTTPAWSLRALMPGVYLPVIVVEIGIGAILPFIPAEVVDRGGSLATAGAMAALIPVGRILADLPAGGLANRIGDRRAMILACLLAAGAAALVASAPGLVLLAVGLFLLGASDAVFGLARQSYLTAVVPPMQRARALSTLGGVARIGLFIGPFAGALVVREDPTVAFWLAVATSLVAGGQVLLSRELAGAAQVAQQEGHGTVVATIREHLHLLTRLGVAILAVGLVRGARMTALPLWGEHLQLDPSTTALIVGVAGGVDMLLFYPAGKLMDARGRLWVAIPSMITMGAAFVALPFTSTALGLTGVALLLGIGNGMGSGVVMTLGADVAPAADRAAFLGAWRLLYDAGSAAGPLGLSAGAALGSLAGGVWAMAGFSAAAALALWKMVPRFSVHANRGTRRRAGIE